ncbi:hypothetical protein GALMADRAFT_243645 [Galerina marginata CBS 339.88]|uniref:Uncharacterized protein n=1 Tax=Galerina marginata (strain CBS 339.88) TaxID=685588 RepID=A0A067T8V0_GALM3|nr:hypothetical protein GALMADRAFT_243645 [Galerina marginata CBS 339.88]
MPFGIVLRAWNPCSSPLPLTFSSAPSSAPHRGRPSRRAFGRYYLLFSRQLRLGSWG